jgi:putative membrane protein
VYHAAATDVISVERFKVMERRLFSIMTLGGALAVLFGISMLIANAAYLQQPWMHAKLTLVILLIGYHLWCYRLLKQFARNQNVHSQRWYRLFNEAHALFLLAIVILVVVKPQW